VTRTCRHQGATITYAQADARESPISVVVPLRRVLNRSALSPPAACGIQRSMANVHDFSAKTITGAERKLAEYNGFPLLIVNVASACGLTPQYAALQRLHEEYGPRGLRVLGFPANEFGAQEPGSNEEIKAFCEARFGVTFDMFAKVVVKGEGMHPLFEHLTKHSKFGGDIQWNFNKFLVSGDGEVVGRFEPQVDPAGPEIRAAIEKLL
jgi:glutathione peroxidase